MPEFYSYRASLSLVILETIEHALSCPANTPVRFLFAVDQLIDWFRTDEADSQLINIRNVGRGTLFFLTISERFGWFLNRFCTGIVACAAPSRGLHRSDSQSS